MGMQTPSFQQPPQPSGKGPQQYSQPSQPTGKGMAQPQQPVSAPEDMNQPIGGPNVVQEMSGIPSIDNSIQPQRAQQGLGKGSSSQNMPFAQNKVTYPGQGGQPQMGKPNTYSNTVGPWDNASIQPQTQSGKGKGH